jgi:hypothetical protein
LDSFVERREKAKKRAPKSKRFRKRKRNVVAKKLIAQTSASVALRRARSKEVKSTPKVVFFGVPFA